MPRRPGTIGLVGNTDQRSDLLRILLADEDDVHAFSLQCAINRLSKPSAFLRVNDREVFAHKIRSFEPELLIVSGCFATPEELRRIKPLANGSPIICLVPSAAEAEASLAAGATDCVLASQEHGLGECLEKHVTGRFSGPHFRQAEKVAAKNPLSSAEEKLEQLDRRIAEYLRKFANITKTQFGRLRHATKIGYGAGRGWTAKQYRQWKVKYLLRKQQRLVQTPISLPGQPSNGSAALDHRQTNGSWEQSATSRQTSTVCEAQDALPKSRWQAAPDEEHQAALRAMELSFKTLFHSALDATFLLDRLGSILHVNPAGSALLGAAPSELLGKTLLSFVPLSQKARASAMWEELLIEGQQKTELVVETVSGEEREVFIAARANLWFGVHLLIASDQTELKKLEAEVRALRQAALDYQTSTGPFGTGIASRCAEAGSMNEENNGAGR